ncbi:flagellar protein FlaG [Heliorestis convoluta]|uniref:Flagellar protein FlaG n=1 Tax=Heliorestis convoluta TaxID=356322 RepID=A0A5Q2N066_9FIRM|nr:flagellar protein FlaG [Heliorestis convoluta]QGG46612.1 hypothetical protein FTV88_0433 [Heliorestis convoluta]
MQIQHNTKMLPPILTQPRHDPDDWKTPAQLKLEHSANIANPKRKVIAQEATNQVYQELREIFHKTNYSVNFVVNEVGNRMQYSIRMQGTGHEVATFPADIAVDIAQKAKHSKSGLFVDQRV